MLSLLCALAPVLGSPVYPGHPTALAPAPRGGFVDATFLCPKCGQVGDDKPNCCSSGGAWEGMCGEGGQYTHHDGYQACNGNPADAKHGADRGLQSVPAWKQCLADIRQHQDELLSPVLVAAHSSSSALLMDPAEHDNIGDNLIVLAEQALLARHGYKAEACRVIQAKYLNNPPCSSQLYADSAAKLAMWHGGGNWGDMPTAGPLQGMRIMTVRDLLKQNKTVLGMPQSMLFQDLGHRSRESQNLQQYMADAHATREQLVLTWRQKDSYEAAKTVYPYATNLLVPDTAFALELDPTKHCTLAPSAPQLVDLILVLRMDSESALGASRSNDFVRRVLDQLPGGAGAGVTFWISDWADTHNTLCTDAQQADPLSQTARFDTEKMLKGATSLLSHGKVVVTDRLHASIMSLLLGLDHVMVEQSYGKIHQTRAVALGVSKACGEPAVTSHFAEYSSLADALTKAVAMLRHQGDTKG